MNRRLSLVRKSIFWQIYAKIIKDYGYTNGLMGTSRMDIIQKILIRCIQIIFILMMCAIIILDFFFYEDAGYSCPNRTFLKYIVAGSLAVCICYGIFRYIGKGLFAKIYSKIY